MISVSVGICAHNEEKNMKNILKALICQNTKKIKISEIIVISSGSTDRTNEIVANFSKLDNRIKLVIQPKREGKASAVNEFIRNANSKILVLESADTIPCKDTVERLCLPFYDEKVGMTGGRPIPVNDRFTFIGFAGHLVWELHHRISMISPKFGEIIAFRNVVREIPKYTAVDEAWIEAIIKKKGYKVVYVPKAIVYNKAPETIADFIKQRRRIYAGHLHLKKELGYSVSTMNVKEIIRVIRDLNLTSREKFYLTGAIMFESFSRMLGLLDYYIFKKNHVVWDIAKTTKEVYK